MTEQKIIIENNLRLRQLREEAAELYMEALILYRKAGAANRRYRAKMKAMRSVEVNDESRNPKEGKCLSKIT